MIYWSLSKSIAKPGDTAQLWRRYTVWLARRVERKFDKTQWKLRVQLCTTSGTPSSKLSWQGSSLEVFLGPLLATSPQGLPVPCPSAQTWPVALTPRPGTGSLLSTGQPDLTAVFTALSQALVLSPFTDKLRCTSLPRITHIANCQMGKGIRSFVSWLMFSQSCEFWVSVSNVSLGHSSQYGRAIGTSVLASSRSTGFSSAAYFLFRLSILFTQQTSVSAPI